MQSKNKVIIAAAGSGKTTFLVNKAIENNEKKTLIVTFTNKNKSEIYNKFIEILGYVPSYVEVKTWYSFLLSECIRPYQNGVYPDSRIEGIFFRDKPAPRYINKGNIKGYYLNSQHHIDRNRIADFALQCFENNRGLVMARLEEIYDSIFIDEVQDMSGFDLEIFMLFFASSCKITMVGDVRQATYFTSQTTKNQKYRGLKILNFFSELEKKNLCKIEFLHYSHRCNQMICDFADNLFPDLKPTESLNEEITGHDGIFVIENKDLIKYKETFNPQILRYNASTKISPAINFGESKGLTFQRVLIKPTKKMEKYLETGNQLLEGESLAKFYVAITRARHSVTIVSDIKSLNVSGVSVYNFR